MKLHFEKSRNHPSFHGPQRCERLDFKVIPAEDGSDEPWMQVNGVKYKHEEFLGLQERIKANDAKKIGQSAYCCCCKLTPCIAVLGGSIQVLSFAEALRNRGERYAMVKTSSVRMLMSTKAVKDFVKEPGHAGDLECISAWVDARCCMALNW